jgi:hypothetical protein
MQDFIGLLYDQEFRDLAVSFTGYDVSVTGKMLFPDNFTGRE